MFHNTASAEVDLFLSDDLKNLRLFLLKRFWFFIPIKVRRIQWTNHPGREIKYCIYKIINRPDHPSFKLPFIHISILCNLNGLCNHRIMPEAFKSNSHGYIRGNMVQNCQSRWDWIQIISYVFDEFYTQRFISNLNNCLLRL